MYAFTHTHTLPPPLNMISSYVCALHISQQAEIHPPTQTHSKSTPKHSNAPSTKYSGRKKINYKTIYTTYLLVQTVGSSIITPGMTISSV